MVGHKKRFKQRPDIVATSESDYYTYAYINFV